MYIKHKHVLYTHNKQKPGTNNTKFFERIQTHPKIVENRLLRKYDDPRGNDPIDNHPGSHSPFHSVALPLPSYTNSTKSNVLVMPHSHKSHTSGTLATKIAALLGTLFCQYDSMST